MKAIFVAALLLASLQTFAQESIVLDISETELERMEKSGKAEVISVRPRFEDESDADYGDYLYFVAGLETHMLPTGAMIGIGVRDKNDIVNGEVRFKANFIGLYNDQGTVAAGAGAQVYVKPFRLLGKNARLLDGVYVGGGYEKYATGRATIDSATNVEAGYEFRSGLRVGISKEDWKRHGRQDEKEVFLIKISSKWPARRK